MSKATLLYLKERPVNSESQGGQSNLNPQRRTSAGAVTKEQKRRPNTIAQHRVNSDTPTPLSKGSTKPNADSSTGGLGSNGSTRAPGLDIYTRSDSPAPDYALRDEGGMPVVNSSKERDTGITGNEVTAPRTPQYSEYENN